MPTFTFTRTDTFCINIKANTLNEAQEIADHTSALDVDISDIVQGEWKPTTEEALA